ncbi:MAG: M20/M25/M40 family metallo-hydrolase [Anaerolineae bacterium]|jgi:glutamate carboxypeptidase|nr:M20/M25/M40 family metallo-hydrolase [Anaerolineae bacterium]
MQLAELKSWIDPQRAEIEQFIRELVEINTYTANTAGVDHAMDVFSTFATQKGLSVERVNERHRLLKLPGATRRPRILLIAHMDTVFPPDGDFLHYEPLPDGFVRGPGTGDIKGGLVMGLYAMLATRELHADLDVQLIVSADEETGSPTIRDWYTQGHVGADYAIGLEPGFPQGELSATVPLGVVYERRGYGAIHFTVTGKSAHSGTPHLGLSAIEAMAQRIIRIHGLNAPERGISTNVGIMSGGISPNTVAGSAEAVASFRFERLEDGLATQQAIEAIICESYVTNPDLKLSDSATCKLESFLPPMERTPESQKIIEAVLAEAQRLGHPVVPIARGGGSDANFTSAAGTPSICGMGAPTHGIHTTEEMIYLPMLFERIELLTATLYRLYQAQ